MGSAWDSICRTLPGKSPHCELLARLKELYPDIAAGVRCTCQGISDFVVLSAKSCIRYHQVVLTDKALVAHPRPSDRVAHSTSRPRPPRTNISPAAVFKLIHAMSSALETCSTDVRPSYLKAPIARALQGPEPATVVYRVILYSSRPSVSLPTPSFIRDVGGSSPTLRTDVGTVTDPSYYYLRLHSLETAIAPESASAPSVVSSKHIHGFPTAEEYVDTGRVKRVKSPPE